MLEGGDRYDEAAEAGDRATAANAVLGRGGASDAAR